MHRNLADHWLWEDKPFSRGQAWIDLLFMVNHKENKTFIDGRLEEVKRGQTITSIRKLCDRWGWSNTKVKKFLLMLEQDEMIVVKSDSKKTVVTIVKYEVYQDSESEKTTVKHQKNDSEASQKHTNKNEKNVKNEKNKYTCAFDDFWKSYPRKVDKGNAYKKFQARLNEGYAERELIAACENYAAECRKNKTETRFIKHASTFLSSTRPFLGYLPKKGEINDVDRQNTADDLVKKGIDLGIGDDFDGF